MKKGLFAMLLLLLVFTASAEPPALPMPWVLTTETYTTTGQVRLYSPNAIYVQTHSSAIPGGCEGMCAAEGQWYRVDLKPYGVSSDAKWAFLAGLLVVTHGQTPETSDLHVTFRAPGDSYASCNKYIGQAIEANVGAGQRSGFSSYVPLVNGEVDFCFQALTPGTWPTNSAYAVNLSIQAWGR